jgi:anti-sigma factor RsiW
MNCQEVMELMQRHVDGDLDPQETSRMTDHVGHCPECAGMLERLVLLSRGLDQLPRVVPPYSLVDAILPELDHWDAAGREVVAPAAFAPRAGRPRRTRRSWIAAMSVAAAAAVVTGLLLLNGSILGGTGGGQEAGSASPSEASDSNNVQDQMKTFATSMAPKASGAMDVPAAKQGAPGISDSPLAQMQSPSALPSAKPSSGDRKSSTGSTESAPSGSPAVSPDSEPRPAQPPTPSGGGNRGLTVNPNEKGSEPPSTEPPVTMPAVPEEVTSPDGFWRAVLTDGKLQVFRTSDDSLVYEQTPDKGMRSGLVWKEDSTAVDYTYTDAEGNQSNRSLQVVPQFQEIPR